MDWHKTKGLFSYIMSNVRKLLFMISFEPSIALRYQCITDSYCYLSFQAACAGAYVWFVVVLLEASGCGPASRVLSGRFLGTNRDFARRKAGQGGITAATDMERHVCGGDSGGQGGWKGKDKRGKDRGVE